MTSKKTFDIVRTRQLAETQVFEKGDLKMVKTNELKAQMKRLGMTQETLAQKLEMNPSTLNRKINNSNGDKMTVAEARKLAEVLNFPKAELVGIFFAKELADTQV